MQLDTLVGIFNYLGLKKPLAWVYHEFRTLGIAKVKPKVKCILPHDPSAYTQGLAYYNDLLYESTGLTEDSRLRCLDPENGQLKHEIRIENEWCEGIAILGSKLVQITYTSGRAIVYDPVSLNTIDEFSYKGEGWGLACYGEILVMSNGSNELVFKDENFLTQDSVSVFLKNRPLKRINDLECAHGKIYANVQFDNNIYEINKNTGTVLRIIDCSEIVASSGRRSIHDMLNGIAYSPASNTFFLTGKNWNFLFKVSFPNN